MLRRLLRQWGWFVLLNRSKENGVVGTVATAAIAERMAENESR